ncbi:hypothetical protein T484DRAFT_1807034, partial [Baffinella frigidus]
SAGSAQSPPETPTSTRRSPLAPRLLNVPTPSNAAKNRESNGSKANSKENGSNNAKENGSNDSPASDLKSNPKP